MKRRRAFKGLALLPLPWSLTLFKGAPSASAAVGLPTIGGAAAGGGAAAVGGGVAAKVAVGLAAVAVAGGAGYEGVTSVESAPRLANPAAQAAERAVAVTSLPTPRVATASRRAVPMPAPVVAPEARVSKPKPKSVAGKSKPERVERVEAAAPLTKAHLEPVRVSRPTKSRTSGTPEQHAKPVKERKVIPIRRKSAALPVEKVAPVRGKSATAPGRVDVKEQKPAPR